MSHARPRVLCLQTLIAVFAILRCTSDIQANDLPLVTDVEPQPVRAQAKRIAEALTLLGQPLSEKQQAALTKAIEDTDGPKAVAAIQAVFDPLCIAGVNINPESRVKVAAGPASRSLVQQGWTVFLVKVHNEAGVTAQLRTGSPNAAPLYSQSTGSPDPLPKVKLADLPDRWLEIVSLENQPLAKTLSGLELEYRVVSLYSRDAGKREAKLTFDVGQGPQDLGFRSELSVLFECRPAVEVTLEVKDVDGQPTTGQFIFRDAQNRVYPARTRRLAPDFFFHDQIYRHSGESVLLPPGKYQVTYTRGPEYVTSKREITVPNAAKHKENFQLERWIHLAKHDWISGDHHIHAAGCAHYESPTKGVTPEDMMRHILGEDLNIGCVLAWGPCWYYQKEFFQGKVHTLSRPNYLMRYDVEVSGFPSSHAGHLCLLRLTEDDYPGTTRIEEWPSWNLPVLQWGKKQGGVVGYSHSGWGLSTKATELPNYEVPKFDGIGANEFIVDVVHDAVDFISAVDTPIHWELNIWYHTLNCGYTTRISGETDFPCIYGERVGLGRAYVKMPGQNSAQNSGPAAGQNAGPKKPLDYDQWVYALRDGRSYCSDGRAHLFDFKIGELEVGTRHGSDKRASFLPVKKGEKLAVSTKAAALLDEKPSSPQIQSLPLEAKPYWSVERSRIGKTRNVAVELIVNGQVVEKKEIPGDGSIHDVKFDYKPERSCWIATRIFPSAHTNPIFVEVDGQPIRASRRSAEWCLEAVDVCWNAKKGKIRPADQASATAAFRVARQAYSKIVEESFDDRAGK